jgi:hypothetical protein
MVDSQTKDVDFYAVHDGLYGRDGGPYLDLVERTNAERQRAAREGRKPDYDNLPATAGTPLVTKAVLRQNSVPMTDPAYAPDRSEMPPAATLAVDVSGVSAGLGVPTADRVNDGAPIVSAPYTEGHFGENTGKVNEFGMPVVEPRDDGGSPMTTEQINNVGEAGNDFSTHYSSSDKSVSADQPAKDSGAAKDSQPKLAGTGAGQDGKSK